MKNEGGEGLMARFGGLSPLRLQPAARFSAALSQRGPPRREVGSGT